jgi:ABC-type amino acid transport substrate-binding protein
MKPHSCHQRKPLPLKGYKNPLRPDDARRLGILLVLFVSLLLNSCNTQDPLTQEERKWLNEHDGKIIVNNEAGWPPIIDIDEKGIPFGIVIDYQALIEKKLNFKFQLDKPDNWDNFMARFRAGKIHVNNNLQKNFEREQYALFTKPYIKIPNVIIVRKDNNKQLTLDQMQGMKIAVTKNFDLCN